jgi:hypothetical protein
MNFTVKVHSALRVARVTLKTAADIPSLTAATASDLGVSPPVEVSPTVWSGSFVVPAPAATSVAIQFDAYDEQYLPSLGTGGTNPAHTDSKAFTANITPVPTAPATNITASVGGLAVGAGTACAGGKPCMWVPLNAGTMTLSAQVVGAPGNGVTSIEFHNANAPGAGTSLLCPSRSPAAPGTPAVPCAQPVSGTGVATLSLNAAEVGKGDVTIFVCPVDATGLQTGACTQMPVLSICGAAGTGVCPGNFTVGRVAACPVSLPCAMPVPPAIGRNVDTPTNHTIYYLAQTAPGALDPQPGLFAQDSLSLSSNPNDQPGTRIGSNHYLADGLVATADGTGVFGIQCTTCTATPAGNIAIDRVDCPSTGNASCYKPSFVTAPAASSFRQIHVATSQAMLISNAAPPASTTGGAAFYASALQSQTTAAAVSIGTLQTVTTINGAANGTGTHWGTMANGAIVAWFNNGGATQPAVYHPNLPGNHVALLPSLLGGPSIGSFDLVVFPTGEIVYQFTTDTSVRFLGAAYYDGTANPPKALAAPINYGSSLTTGPAKNFITAGAGVLLGELPANGSTTSYQAIEINLFAGTATAPASFIPIPFDGTTTGTFHDGVAPPGPPGVFARTGVASNFSVSDDKTKAIFVTDDPHAAGQTATIWRLHLVDLATGTQVSLAGSERMLCAFTSTAAPADCVPNAAGTAHYPRFVHSAPVYVGGAPTGLNQAVVWEEESRVQASSTTSRRARISFATFSGAGSPAVSSVDRLNTYSIAANSAATVEVESAAGGAIFFLSDNDLGGVDLYAAPLTPPAASPTVSSKVIDRVFGFKVREDKGRMIVARADGTLYFAALPGGGANPASGLVPIAVNAPSGDTVYGPIGAPSVSFGFTPDGDHAFAVIDEQLFFGATLGYYGVLETIDLTTPAFARTDWGRIAYSFISPLTAGFISNAAAGEIVDQVSVENLGRGRLSVVLAANPTGRGDTRLFVADPSLFAFRFTPSLDGSEGLFLYAGAANALSGNGNFLPVSAGAESLLQAATNSPFGGPYRPEYSEINGALFSGAAASIFKVWGTTPPATSPPPFVTVSRGFSAAAATPLQTRQTPDNKELLYSFVDGSDANGSYTIWLPLSGRGPPSPLLP